MCFPPVLYKSGNAFWRGDFTQHRLRLELFLIFSQNLNLYQGFCKLIQEDVITADANEVVVKSIAEDRVMGEAKEEVAKNINPIKWQVTMILTL